MNEEVEELLRTNTWASIRLTDVPSKLRYTLVVTMALPVKDMFEKGLVTKAIEKEEKEIAELKNKLENWGKI